MREGDDGGCGVVEEVPDEGGEGVGFDSGGGGRHVVVVVVHGVLFTKIGDGLVIGIGVIVDFIGGGGGVVFREIFDCVAECCGDGGDNFKRDLGGYYAGLVIGRSGFGVICGEVDDRCLFDEIGESG